MAPVMPPDDKIDEIELGPTPAMAAKRHFPPIGLLTLVDGQCPVIAGRSP
jgi:hypothetical protein